MSHDSARVRRRSLSVPGPPATGQYPRLMLTARRRVKWPCSPGDVPRQLRRPLASATRRADDLRNTSPTDTPRVHSSEDSRGVVRGPLAGFTGVFASYARAVHILCRSPTAAGHKAPTCVRRIATPGTLYHSNRVVTLEVGSGQIVHSRRNNKIMSSCLLDQARWPVLFLGLHSEFSQTVLMPAICCFRSWHL